MSFTANFKLAQKGIILVAFPLACELVFVSYLLHLLHQSELLRVQSEHARTMIAGSDRLIQLFYQAGAALVPGGAEKKAISAEEGERKVSERYTEIVEKIPRQYETLCTLARGHGKEEDALAVVAPTLQKGEQLLQSVKSNIDSGNGMVSALSELAHKRKSMFALIREVQSMLAQVSDPAKEIERLNPGKEQENANHILQTIWVGIALNIVVALGLARFFSQSIVNRLNTVAENTHRVARELPLQSPISGNDEIAALDRIFHEMAETVVATRKRERAVVDNVLDVICSIDSRTRFKSVNNASKSVWGYEPRDLYNLTLFEVISEEQKSVVREALKQIKESGSGSFECAIDRPNGSPVEMLWSASYAEKEDSYFCVAHDVSAQRRVERLKKQFVAMVSHDLRTPLNSVLNLLTLVGTGVYGELDETGGKRIAAAEQDVERLIGLINELLQLEKLEAGKLHLNLSAVSLDDLIERSLVSVEAVADEKKIKITAPPTGKSVMADAPRIIQVLVNLLSNAVKASSISQSITISASANGDKASVTVADEGCGIPLDLQKKIFEPFEQIASTLESGESDKNNNGFGLGLAISKQIIEQHGGRLSVESEPGRGTRFSFTLPLSMPSEKNADK